MFLHRWEVSVRINLPLFSTVVPSNIYYILDETTVENKGKLILCVWSLTRKKSRPTDKDGSRMYPEEGTSLRYFYNFNIFV